MLIVLDLSMSRNKKIIIGILITIIIVVVLWAIWTWLTWRARQVAPVVPPEEAVSEEVLPAPAVPIVLPPNFIVPPAAVLPAEASTVEAIARSFAERFGSYSNQSNFENIADLYPFMTDKMRQWAEDYIAEARIKRASPVSYWGITTRALAVKILEQEKDRVLLVVTTSRRESTAEELTSKVFMQDIQILFVKENDFWKADSAEWK